jgi:hypothetical protein
MYGRRTYVVHVKTSRTCITLRLLNSFVSHTVSVLLHNMHMYLLESYLILLCLRLV